MSMQDNKDKNKDKGQAPKTQSSKSKNGAPPKQKKNKKLKPNPNKQTNKKKQQQKKPQEEEMSYLICGKLNERAAKNGNIKPVHLVFLCFYVPTVNLKSPKVNNMITIDVLIKSRPSVC